MAKGIEPFVVTYTIICTIVLASVLTYLVISYAHVSVPCQAKFITWLSWFLCLSLIYILPLDLTKNSTDYPFMETFYRVLYWGCFFLTWVFTPFQSAYVIIIYYISI